MPHRKERRGRPRITTQAAHRDAYDGKYGKGFSERVLKVAERLSLAELLEKYGAKTDWSSRQAISRALASMRGKPKRRVRGKTKMMRPDVTVSRIRKLAKVLPSISAIAKACRTWHDTVERRVRQGGVVLPNGRGGSLRCNIPPERLRHFARKGECAAAIARRFGYWSGTVTQHAERLGIRLPNGNAARSASAARRRQKVWRLHEKKNVPARRIALLLGASSRTVEDDLQRHRRFLRRRRIAS